MSSSRRLTLLQIIRSPVFIIFIVCLGLMSYNLVYTYHLRPFSSDDVFWQTILLNWHPFNGDTVTLGNSSVYVDRLPYYMLFNHFFEPSRKVIFMEASIAGLAGFSAFYWSSVYFLKKLGARLSYPTLLPFAWLASLGYSFSSLYLNPNWRSFQIGISFVYFATVAALWWGDINFKSLWSKLLLVVASAYAGLQIYSDPYFLYFTVGPVIILAVALYVVRRINRRQLLPVALLTILGLVFAKLFALIATDAGIHTTTGYKLQFVQFDNLATGFWASLHNILIIFSADFFGHNFDASALVLLLNFGLLCYVLYKVWPLLAKSYRVDWRTIAFDKVWPVFFVFVCALIFLTHTISTMGLGTATYRYFLMLELLFIVLFALAISATSNSLRKSFLVATLVLAVLSNLAFVTFSDQDTKRFEVADNRENTLNYLVTDMLRSRGYDKGYANYWDASISTYLSDNKVSYLPSVCVGPDAKKWHWLINDNAFDKPASQTFLWIDPDVPAACSANNMIHQFGKPQDRLYIGDKTIFLYNYDITPRLKLAPS